MKTLSKNTDGQYVFVHDDIEIDNPIISECGRFSANPEQYGFKITSTGGGCSAHAQEFMLDGKPVLMLLTDGNLNCINDETITANIGLYDLDMEFLGQYWEVNR